jgi:hypothetical protein
VSTEYGAAVSRYLPECNTRLQAWGRRLASIQGNASMVTRRTLYSCGSPGHVRGARNISSAHSEPVPPRGGLVVTSVVVIRA